MLKQLLRSHVCHVQVDEYAECLVRKKVISEDDVGRIDVNAKLAASKCKAQVDRYHTCMESQPHHQLIYEQAATNAKCTHAQQVLLGCLERAPPQQATQTRLCYDHYLAALRCGMNHMWNDYWRALSGFGVEEELHLFDLSRRQDKATLLTEMETKYKGRENWVGRNAKTVRRTQNTPTHSPTKTPTHSLTTTGLSALLWSHRRLGRWCVSVAIESAVAVVKKLEKK